MNRGAPFGDFAASLVVFVAGGFALGVGDDGGLVEVLVIDRGGAVAGGVGAADAAPGEVAVRGRGVAAAVRGGPGDARGGVGSGEGAANAAVIALRGDEAIHDPRRFACLSSRCLWFSRHREGARRAPLLCSCDGEYP